MARQRFRLKELFQKEPQYYHATFDHITHKINAQKKKIPVVLLTDVYLVNDLDKKIRLVNSNDFKDKKGRHCGGLSMGEIDEAMVQLAYATGSR